MEEVWELKKQAEELYQTCARLLEDVAVLDNRLKRFEERLTELENWAHYQQERADAEHG
jgi:hypothetical protein